ncbi:TrmH family RNA methyltransferase [Calorimonas adulescens]|jgi:SpoU rRNA Methylase family./RNA 2'-O ribose methyltransferase substrate binding.|uniref:RNA methyltransferase n=1 Tax=Calorimonas adulescens TaxID=2606906 RepID=A0A5D8QE59_9THEO|nr:RNA methyltransferase [Calorimonas adulescens]TZE82792.1 RNA methyltransferase [Calorimonas adulescens]
MIVISSRQNPLVKKVISLKQKKWREEYRKYIIEGLKNVREALSFGVDIDYIFIDSGQDSLIEEFAYLTDRVILVAESIFKELSDTKTPQGVIALASFYSYSLDNILRDGNIFLVLDRIQDPGNMGTLIRSADAFGVEGILISKGSVDIYSPKVVRAAMGSIFHVPFVYADIWEIIKTLKENKIVTLATTPYAEKNIRDAYIKPPVAIFLGNEANGLDGNIIDACDEKVRIYMKGKAESLNVSIAGSIIMHEILLKIHR